MGPIYRGDLVSPGIAYLRSPPNVQSVAAFWTNVEGSGEARLDQILDELQIHHEGRIFDYFDMELDLTSLRPAALWRVRDLQRMPSLRKFRAVESFEVVDLFGEDARRTMNALKRFADQAPKQSLSRALLPRFMMLWFAREIRQRRLSGQE